VLLSWAVPKGPSPDPAEKRLAVEVEDHPVEYADFEGIIPKDNYGAGPVIVWDRGSWLPLEDPDAGIEKGKLLFELRGYKMRGEWTLVRTKSKGREKSKEWLLIKHADAWSGPEGARPFGAESVLSGLTLEELLAGPQRATELRAELERLGAPRRDVHAADVKVMLAERREPADVFSSPEWLFEFKWDGFRLLAGREGGKARLIYRRGSDATSLYLEVARALESLPFGDLVLDGEVVVRGERGRTSFQRLQKRALLHRPADLARARLEYPAEFCAFDLLAFEGFDLRPLPLVTRKGLLRRLLPRAGALRYSDHVEAQGQAVWDYVKREGLEGMVAKRADATYRGERSADWLKFKRLQVDDFVVVGFTAPEGTRAGFGALHLGVYVGRELRYVGRVGSGFSDEQLQQTRARLDELVRDAPAASGALLPSGPAHTWVEPRLVVEVRYHELTFEPLLRQPVFLRFRDDKTPQECELSPDAFAPDDPGLVPDEPGPESPGAADAPAERKVPFSNLDKPFWPDDGYTKGDLIEYYRAVSPWLLPYLRDRPVVLTRYPDGIAGKSFFQKDAPGFVPGWVRTERMWSEHAQREIDYFICDDLEMLLYIVNLGTIPLHVWSSRVKTLAQPDWCILDFDPKGAPFEHVVRLALRARQLCEEIGLPCFPKTSGASGLHVLVPLGQQCTYEQSRAFGEVLARVLCEAEPDIATVTRAVGARAGKVYVDYLQNGHGRLLAGMYSVRPLPGATVSTPLDWGEVGPDLDPRVFTLRSVPERLGARGDDPLLPVLTLKPDLGAALARLASRLRA
jgi:bifunctional non-homologous end joining protein LigD